MTYGRAIAIEERLRAAIKELQRRNRLGGSGGRPACDQSDESCPSTPSGACARASYSPTLSVSAFGVILRAFKDRANKIYKRVEDLKSSRARNQDAILVVCLHIGCRQDKP